MNINFYWKTTPATMWEKHTQLPTAPTTQCSSYEKQSPLKDVQLLTPQEKKG